ncbi:MAG: hypothetical protein LH618_14060, partial [Saprospiraceae bacterium]|nr:hypothetical protein [Saprospiraceae bacterium]
MQKIFFALLFWATCCAPTLAQEWHGNIYLRTQTDVDSFPLKYGPLEVLWGNLNISSGSTTYTDISDLSPLASLHQVWGSLYVLKNGVLQSLHGLEALDTVFFNLAIAGNPQLQDLHGLRGLRDVHYNFIIEDNDSLRNLAGLDSLLYVASNLLIRDNDELQNLEGLGALGQSGYLDILYNSHLESLAGMDALSVATGVDIVGNARLKSLSGLNNLKNVFSSITIADNDSLETCAGFPSLHKTFSIAIQNNPRLLQIGNFASPDSLEVGRLYIQDNPRIRTLHGLQHLTALLLSANIERNDSLQSLQGLEVERIGTTHDYSRADLFIRDNSALTDLALNHLRVIGQPVEAENSHVEIRRNHSLKALNGLAVLDSCHARLWVGENDSLLTIDIPSLRYGYNIYMDTDSVEGAQIGSFENLEYVGQDLYIYGAKNTEGFAHLRKVGGDLRIVAEKGHIKGFNQLQKVGHSLSIYGLPYLDVLDGFHVLKGTGSSLGCSNVRDTMRAFEQVDTVGYTPNSSLGVAFSNLFYNECYFDSCYKNLAYVSGTFTHGSGILVPAYLGDTLPNFPVLQKIGYKLQIYNCEQGLSSINIFPQLTRIGPNIYTPSSTSGLFISNNGHLQSLNGLEHLTKIVGKIEIYENDSLSDCSALCPVLQHAVISGPVNIYDNPFPCSSKPEVLAWCDTAYVSTGGPQDALPFELWPNPTTGSVQVQRPDGAAQSCTASLYDLGGRML